MSLLVQVLMTLLGPAFALAVMQDSQFILLLEKPQPDVGEQCFSDYQSRRPGDVMASIQSLRLSMSSITSLLHEISMQFMRNQVICLSCNALPALLQSMVWASSAILIAIVNNQAMPWRDAVSESQHA